MKMAELVLLKELPVPHNDSWTKLKSGGTL